MTTRIALLLKKSYQKVSKPADFPFIQLIGCTSPLDEINKALGFKCVRWSTDAKVYHTLQTPAGFKISEITYSGKMTRSAAFPQFRRSSECGQLPRGLEPFTKGYNGLIRCHMLTGLRIQFLSYNLVK